MVVTLRRAVGPIAFALAVALCWGHAAAPLSARQPDQKADSNAVEPPGPSDERPVTKGVKAPSKATPSKTKPAPSKPAPSKPTPSKPPQPADFKSAHFLIHTDLPAKEAQELLHRLEVMLKLIAGYWGHQPLGTIECYVVRDLSCWPADVLTPQGRAKIREGAGVTLVETLTRGERTVAAKAVVYASADHGTPQHEAVHAYCGQTFGKLGPLWYSEGMAEMGQYWKPGDAAVHCPDHVIRYIRRTRAKPLGEILAEDGVPRADGRVLTSGDSWQNYAWRWALCHLLENNTNYSSRFRALGNGFLTGRRVTFAEAYGSMQDEINFEYDFFLKHLDAGYRVDLCSWDWKRKFRPPSGDSAMIARIAANKGWQASGVTVAAGKRYDYSASGVAKRKGGTETTADGGRDGSGQLEGIVFNSFSLSEPFPLSAYGTFAPPADGKLYLRCRDDWNQLADNRGAISIKIKNSGQGSKLTRPTRKAEEPPEEPAEESADPDEPTGATAKTE